MACRPLTVIVLLLAGLGLSASAARGDGGSEGRAPPGLRDRLERIDREMARVHTLAGDFVKRQSTQLLKHPLVTRGTVRMTEDYVRWDTAKPRVSHTLIGGGEVRILYPRDKRLAVYPLDKRFAQFGVGPMPRMSELAKRFVIRRSGRELAAKVAGVKRGNPLPDRLLALTLTPRSKALGKHLKGLVLVLDTKAHVLRALGIDQPDGSRTTYRFSNLKLNPRIDKADLALHPPPGTQVVHPYSPKDQGDAAGDQHGEPDHGAP